MRDHHPGSVRWDRYLATRAQLRDTTRQVATSRAGPQPAQALLPGPAVRGRNSCRMRAHYGPTSPSYICRTGKKRYGEQFCRCLVIAHGGRAVGEVFLPVVAPAAVDV